MCVCGDVEGHEPLRALGPFVTGCLLFVTGCLWSFVTGCLWSFVPGCLLLVTGCRPLLTGAVFLQSSWLCPKARPLFLRHPKNGTAGLTLAMHLCQKVREDPVCAQAPLQETFTVV